MVKIVDEISVGNFDGWSGAEDTIEKVREAGKIDELDQILEEMFPEGISTTGLNDLLRFDDEYVLSLLGIEESEGEEEEGCQDE